MIPFSNKIILTPIKEENTWGYEDKDAAKLGKVAFPFVGKLDEQPLELKKGVEVYYQYGTNIKIEGTEFVIVSPSNLICQK